MIYLVKRWNGNWKLYIFNIILKIVAYLGTVVVKLVLNIKEKLNLLQDY